MTQLYGLKVNFNGTFDNLFQLSVWGKLHKMLLCCAKLTCHLSYNIPRYTVLVMKLYCNITNKKNNKKIYCAVPIYICCWLINMFIVKESLQ